MTETDPGTNREGASAQRSHDGAAEAALLNADRLDFDGRLTFEPIEAVVRLTRYAETEPDQVVERARGRRILITKELPLPADLIDRLPAEVELICEAGTGFDNIDLSAGKTKDGRIVVCNVPGYSTESVARLTLCFILTLGAGVHRLIRSVESGDRADFQGHPRPSNVEPRGKTLGVIGAGAIGRRVVALARAFDMRALVYSRSPKSWDDAGIRQVGLDELLTESDFVTLHCALGEGTHHLIRAETLRKMKRGACLINTARGGLVRHEDLAEVLASGHLAGAALDVQEPEPLPAGHVLWSRPEVILTPHIGWKAIEPRQRLVGAVADNIRAFLAHAPTNVVH